MILVGGQALNFWAERYLENSSELRREAPFASKDIDFQGTREVVRVCAERLHGEARFPTLDDATPNLAVVLFADSNGYERRIDFLESPYGLDPQEAREMAIPVEFVSERSRGAGLDFRVLHPVLCLESRICNTVGLPKYQGPRGLQQARASVICAREFLRRDLLPAEKLDDVRTLNERIFRFATRHRAGREAAVAFGIEPFKAAVVDDRLPEKFRTMRFPQMEAHIAQQRATQVRQAVELGPRREREWAERVHTELESALRSREKLETPVDGRHERSTTALTPSDLVEHAEREATRKHPSLAREVRVYRTLVECNRSAANGVEQQIQALGRAAEHTLTPLSADHRALLVREAEQARPDASRSLAPSNDDAIRKADGDGYEVRWRAAVSQELTAIRARAADLQVRTERALAAIAQHTLEHRKLQPERPNAMLRLVRGDAAYEAAAGVWCQRHDQLTRRKVQLESRLAILREYAREPAAGFRTKGVELAERRAELREPDLARAVTEYRTWLQRDAKEHAPPEPEARGLSRRSSDRSYER